MTIQFIFDPIGIADNTTLTSLGFTEFPALNGDDSPQAAPNFKVSGGQVVCNAFPGAVLPPRVVKNLGAPITRGEVRMKHDTKVGVLVTSDALQQIQMLRNFYGATTYALIFSHNIGGADQPGTFNYHVLFQPGSANGNSLPSEVDVAWVVNGTNLEIYVQGKRCVVRDFINGGFRDSIPIPAALQGATRAGFFPQFNNRFAFPLVLRDNADLMYCSGVEVVRASDDSSRLVLSGSCTKAGVSHIVVDIADAAGGAIFHGIANVVSGGWTIQTGPIAKAYEAATIVANITNADTGLTVTELRFGSLAAGDVLIGDGMAVDAKIASQSSGPAGGAGSYVLTAAATATGGNRVFTAYAELRITAVNQEGTPEPRRVFFQMPRTLKRQTFRLGNNESVASYFGGMWPFRDLAKALEWRTAANYIMPVNADPAYFDADNGFNAHLPASIVDLAPNGSPRKFPDNPALSVEGQLPWYPEPGVYVMDMTEAPNLPWAFQNTAGCVATDLDYFGPKLHRVTITTPDGWIPTASSAGFGILFTRDNSKPNKGMPTVAWEWRLTKVGGTPGCLWSDSFVAWMRESGLGHYRWMSGQMAVEPAFLPRGITTAAKRTKLTDQSWTNQFNTRPEFPFELIVDLHNRTKKDLWYNFPRTADESYIRAFVAYVRDHLDPALTFYWTLSNEVWNFGQRQIFAYAADGMAIGLGKGREATAKITSGSNVIELTTALYGRCQVGQRVIGRGIPAGTTITAQGTGTGRTGTYTMSANATRTASIPIFYDAPIVGGDGVYDYSAVPAWHAGMVLAVGDLVANYHIFRSLSNFTSNVNPTNVGDWDNFELVQHGDLAAWRSHAEHLAQVYAIVRDEMGAGPYAARCRLVVERWHSDLVRTLLPYLDWGDLLSKIDVVVAAGYFGAEGIFQWASASSAVRTATATQTGAARIAAWVTAAKASAMAVADQHRRNAIAFVNLLEERGLQEGDILFGTYEGGPEYAFDFRNSQLATTGAGPIDQTTLRDDILTFHEDYQLEILSEYYEALRDACGGICTHFDSFTPTRHSTFFVPGQAGYVFWGVSQDAFDRADTSTKYKALRDVSIEHGGGAIIAEPARRRRRLAPALLS